MSRMLKNPLSAGLLKKGRCKAPHPSSGWVPGARHRLGVSGPPKVGLRRCVRLKSLFTFPSMKRLFRYGAISFPMKQMSRQSYDSKSLIATSCDFLELTSRDGLIGGQRTAFACSRNRAVKLCQESLLRGRKPRERNE